MGGGPPDDDGPPRSRPKTSHLALDSLSPEDRATAERFAQLVGLPVEAILQTLKPNASLPGPTAINSPATEVSLPRPRLATSDNAGADCGELEETMDFGPEDQGERRESANLDAATLS